jgi:hypothetical protein
MTDIIKAPAEPAQIDSREDFLALSRSVPEWEDFVARLRRAIDADPHLLDEMRAALDYGEPPDALVPEEMRTGQVSRRVLVETYGEEFVRQLESRFGG